MAVEPQKKRPVNKDLLRIAMRVAEHHGLTLEVAIELVEAVW